MNDLTVLHDDNYLVFGKLTREMRSALDRNRGLKIGLIAAAGWILVLGSVLLVLIASVNSGDTGVPAWVLWVVLAADTVGYSLIPLEKWLRKRYFSYKERLDQGSYRKVLSMTNDFSNNVLPSGIFDVKMVGREGLLAVAAYLSDKEVIRLDGDTKLDDESMFVTRAKNRYDAKVELVDRGLALCAQIGFEVDADDFDFLKERAKSEYDESLNAISSTEHLIRTQIKEVDRLMPGDHMVGAV